MKVLFICSQNSEEGISPVVANQIHSLKKAGAVIDLFGIKGKGLKGYFKAVFELKKRLKGESFHVFHAHYGLSAIVATMAGAKPLVVSLMGSDVKEGGWQQRLIKHFAKRRWAATIAKSQELADIVGNKYCKVIPNGVDLDVFKPMPQQKCRIRLNLEQNKTYFLFAANPSRKEKNFALAKNAFDKLNIADSELVYLQNIPHAEIPVWMNAVDVVVLTSLWEGSPNVIKEAMACNRPVVSTLVGDVGWLFGNEAGHFVAGHNVEEFTAKVSDAFQFVNQYKKTNGSKRIKELGLDSKGVAKEIISIYLKVTV